MARQTTASALAVVAALAWWCSIPAAAFSASVQATFYISPKGSDANPGTESRPFATMDRAKKAVRAVNKEMSGDIVVMLSGGVYDADQTILFEAADSGTGGHDVIYRAVPKESPVLSGGRPIHGWQQDVGKRWKAKTDVEGFRQLYVGGVRAVRARSGRLGDTSNPGRCEFLQDLARRGGLPGVERVGDEGYRTTAVKLADWRNIGDIEFCYITTWNHTRCRALGVRVDGDHAVVRMLQPYFTHARTKEGTKVDLPVYIENALELLNEPGEWYHDVAAKTVYYIPRPGEDMTKVEVLAPAVEKLVELRGTLDAPVQNIRFEGITFQHGGWLRPNKIGHCDVQANFIVDSTRNDMITREGGVVNVHNEQLKSPANVVLHAAKGVRFERCTFTQLGGAGLDIEFGSQNNVVSGCTFFDISGSAIQIGDVLKDDHHPDDPRKIVRNNAVENCYIHDCCLEYMGGVGIFAGYTDRTRIAHNVITRLPYTAVSVGWGWGEEDAGGGAYKQPQVYDTPTPAKNNRIEMNDIHHVMLQMHDGGGIYTLGNMPNTIIRGNHVHNNVGEPGGIYLDEGSGQIQVTRNIVYGVKKPMNYNNDAQNRRATCKEHDNFFGGETMPDGAVRDIVKSAGLEPAYQDLLPQK
jgi:hypothetical protein